MGIVFWNRTGDLRKPLKETCNKDENLSSFYLNGLLGFFLCGNKTRRTCCCGNVEDFEGV